MRLMYLLRLWLSALSLSNCCEFDPSSYYMLVQVRSACESVKFFFSVLSRINITPPPNDSLLSNELCQVNLKVMPETI